MLACGVSCGKCRCWLPLTPPPRPMSACGSGSLLWASLLAMLLPNRMIELSSTVPLPSLHLLEALDEPGEDLGVVVLDLPQVGDAVREPAPVRGRVERLVDVQVRIGPHAGFLDHLHRGHPGPVGLPGQRDHLELHVEQLAEVLRRTERRARQRPSSWRSSPASARAARSRGPNPGSRSREPGRPRRACGSGWPSRRARSRAGCSSCSGWPCALPACRPARTCRRTPCADCSPSAAAGPACGTRSCRPARRTVPATAAACPCPGAAPQSDRP